MSVKKAKFNDLLFALATRTALDSKRRSYSCRNRMERAAVLVGHSVYKLSSRRDSHEGSIDSL